MSTVSVSEIRQVERLLAADPVRNVSPLGFLRENPVTHCWTCGDAAMFRGISDHEWIYVSADHKTELTALLSQVDPDERYFAALEDWMEPLVLQGRPTVWRLVTRRFVLPAIAPRPTPHPDAMPLDPSDARHIHQLSEFPELAQADYIHDRICAGPSAGIRAAGKLVAWGITHDDGALGLIHVLPSARRQGLGAAIIATLSHLILARGRIPFSHIEDSNTASIALHLRAGFEAGPEIRWLERG